MAVRSRAPNEDARSPDDRDSVEGEARSYCNLTLDQGDVPALCAPPGPRGHTRLVSAWPLPAPAPFPPKPALMSPYPGHCIVISHWTRATCLHGALRQDRADTCIVISHWTRAIVLYCNLTLDQG